MKVPMRLLIAVMPLLMLTSKTQAYIVFDFDSAGIYAKFGTPVTPGPPVRPDFEDDAVNGGKVMVVWSSDAIIEAVIGSATAGSARPSNDYIMGTTALDSSGMISAGSGNQKQYTWQSGELNGNVTETQFYNGYVYIIVFDTANPAYNDHYVAGSRNAIGQVWGQNSGPYDVSGDKKLTVDPTPTDLTKIELGDMTTSSSAVTGEYGANYIVLNSTVIPEPGTIGLFALGLAGLAARRKLRK